MSARLNCERRGYCQRQGCWEQRSALRCLPADLCCPGLFPVYSLSLPRFSAAGAGRGGAGRCSGKAGCRNLTTATPAANQQQPPAATVASQVLAYHFLPLPLSTAQMADGMDYPTLLTYSLKDLRPYKKVLCPYKEALCPYMRLSCH